MQPCSHVSCTSFPCEGVNQNAYRVPAVEIDPAAVRVVLISECAAPQAADDYYAPGEPLFAQTTLLAFQDAGLEVDSIQALLTRGIYLTSALKCGKIGYGVPSKAIKECSFLLERELDLFPSVCAYLLMGDVAILAINAIAKRAGQRPAIPCGPTYKIRSAEYYFRSGRAFPSYLQAGRSFFIEKSKRRMIAADIAQALALVKN